MLILMLVILMLILMLINLNADYAGSDADFVSELCPCAVKQNKKNNRDGYIPGIIEFIKINALHHVSCY